LVIGGSDGGLTTVDEAALLASHGYPAMALAYFRAPGLPRELKDIPLEYFARALRRLRARPDVDPRHAVVVGVSRGGEASLLIGATYPRLVHGVAALVPSNVVNPATDGRSAAWTLGSRPLPHIRPVDFGDPDPVRTPEAVIRAERIAGPVLTASGGVDALWPSTTTPRPCTSASPRTTSPTRTPTCASRTPATASARRFPICPQPQSGTSEARPARTKRRRPRCGPASWTSCGA
jgi:dienelactone hydrolase